MSMSKTHKTRGDKNMIVEFSHLNDNNKTQFLEFLLSNNITFERTNVNGKNDYVAKVVVPKPENNTSRYSMKKDNKQNFDYGIGKNVKKNMVVNKGNMKGEFVGRNNQGSILQVNQNIDSFRLTTPRKNNNENLNRNIGTSITKIGVKNEIGSINKKSLNKNMNRNDEQMSVKKERNKNVKNEQMIVIKTTQFLNYDDSLVNVNKGKEKQGVVNKGNGRQRENRGNDRSFRKNDRNKRKQNEQRKDVKRCQLNSSIMTFTNNEQFFEGSLSRQKQKRINKNVNLKQKTQKLKEINQLVNKYLKLFEIRLNGQRPIKWSLGQLIKMIEEIYNELFMKNTQVVARRLGIQNNCNNFIRFIRQFFMNKYKNQKLVNSNIINMLYSLSYYLQNQKEGRIVGFNKNEMGCYVRKVKVNESMTCCGYFLQGFEDFLCEIYQFEELLYYLFIRSIIIGEIGKMQIKQNLSNNNKNGVLMVGEICLNFSQIEKILGEILGRDTDLIQEYKCIIKMHVDSNGFINGQKQIRMSVGQLMGLLVQDYRAKRLIMEEERVGGKMEGGVGYGFQGDVQSNKSNNNNTNNNTNNSANNKTTNNTTNNPNKIKNILKQNNVINSTNKRQADELTFGQQTQQNIQLFLEQHRSMQSLYGNSNGNILQQFWQINQEMLDEGNCYDVSSLQYLIIQKMKKKVFEFFNILIENRSQYNSANGNGGRCGQGSMGMGQNNLVVLSLFMHKSLNLLWSIINMNKIEWFQELKVNDPSQQDFDKIEELQLLYKKLKMKPEAQGIGWLCKSILTVTQLVSNLQKLMESML